MQAKLLGADRGFLDIKKLKFLYPSSWLLSESNSLPEPPVNVLWDVWGADDSFEIPSTIIT
jgi:hypothetical protein